MLTHQNFAHEENNLFSDIYSFPGENLLIIFDNCTPPNNPAKVETVYERKFSSLNQALSKLDEWQDFLTNKQNREQLCHILVDYYTSDEIVTRKKNCHKMFVS